MAFRRFARRHADLLLALGLTVLAQVEIWSQEITPERVAYAALALPITGALTWRVRAPLAVLAVAAAAYFLATLLVPPSGDDAIAVAVALLIAVYSVGAHTEGWQAVAGVLATLAVVLAAVAGDPEEATLGSYTFFLLMVGGPWLAGRAIRHRRLSERDLEARAFAAESEREEKARLAVVEERARIARELHDVVTHHLSVAIIQIVAALGELGPRAASDGAGRHLGSAEASCRQALADMRRLLDVLRPQEAEAELEPTPGLAALGDLIAGVRNAGLPIEVAVEGAPADLPAGLDLAAYRIVQEALTNALKYAGGARTALTLRYAEAALDIEVVDEGRQRPRGGNGSGRGLVGMRERVALYGGRLEAGPRDGGGFRVWAHLPLEPNAA